MSIGFPGEAAEKLKVRVGWFLPLLLVLCSIYTARLWYMQVYMGAVYREKSQIYRIRSERVPAVRGFILDRTGRTIVENKPGFAANIIPEDCPNLADLRVQLEGLLPNHREQIDAKWGQLKSSPVFQAFPLVNGLTFPEVILLETRLIDLPGLSISYNAKRSYPFGEQASHLIGYMGKITQQEWEKIRQDGDTHLAKYDMIGKSGIEKILNSELTGIPGTIIYEADVHGRKIEVLNNPDEQRAVPGKDVWLTLDWGLQTYVEELFASYVGAIVVMDTRSGDILAFVNRPAYDPNAFSDGISVEEWQTLTADPRHPLLNRALQSAYSPGSIFKIVTAITGLEKRVIRPETTAYNCTGTVRLLNDYRDCWKKGGHGTMNVHTAIVNSCNIFFFNVATGLNMDDIAGVANRLGLGQKTGIILPNEEPGLIPTPEWKRRVLKQPWWAGETLSVAIGQGSVLTTPLQIVRMMAAIANGGHLLVPNVIHRIGEGVGPGTRVISNLNLNPTILEHVRDGLRGVVNEDGGTARRAQLPGITVAGKTGTTQVVGKEMAARYGKDIPWRYRDHNWFACFAPYENPSIAIVVFIEHGGKEGGSHKVAIARDIIHYYFIKTNDGMPQVSPALKPDPPVEVSDDDGLD